MILLQRYLSPFILLYYYVFYVWLHVWTRFTRNNKLIKKWLCLWYCYSLSITLVMKAALTIWSSYTLNLLSEKWLPFWFALCCKGNLSLPSSLPMMHYVKREPPHLYVRHLMKLLTYLYLVMMAWTCFFLRSTDISYSLLQQAWSDSHLYLAAHFNSWCQKWITQFFLYFFFCVIWTCLSICFRIEGSHKGAGWDSGRSSG